MKVKELISELQQYDQELEVITVKRELFGTCGLVRSTNPGTYGFFGADIPCVVISDEFREDEDGSEDGQPDSGRTV